ncbi:MAG: hypothetical protein M1838_005072 [Thelocarpon superellum]|nr:MAG: hypothetical protein M1838_005072 [Thelocarpon superellum]
MLPIYVTILLGLTPALARLEVDAADVQTGLDSDLLHCTPDQEWHLNKTSHQALRKLDLALATDDGLIWDLYFSECDPGFIRQVFHTARSSTFPARCATRQDPRDCIGGQLFTLDADIISFCPMFFERHLGAIGTNRSFIKDCVSPFSEPEWGAVGPELDIILALIMATHLLDASHEPEAKYNSSNDATDHLNSWCETLPKVQKRVPCTAPYPVEFLSLANHKEVLKSQHPVVLTQWVPNAYMFYAQAIWAHHANECPTIPPPDLRSIVM